MTTYRKIRRPGFFGRRRDEIVAGLNAEFGKGVWTLIWDGEFGPLEFEQACIYYYGTSYLKWFMDNPMEVDYICANFSECIDNATTNVRSGLDYTKQEAFSTHIQDIAVRNALHALGRKFEGPVGAILIIRSADSEGYKYGPGNIPFTGRIEQPSKCPRWANKGSVEDFWQSNKWVAIKE